MKIKMLQSVAGHADPRYALADFSFAPGTVVELNDALAKAWIASDTAIPAKKGDDLTMPVEAYTLKASSPLMVAYREAEAAAEAKAQAEADAEAAAEAEAKEKADAEAKTNAATDTGSESQE